MLRPCIENPRGRPAFCGAPREEKRKNLPEQWKEASMVWSYCVKMVCPRAQRKTMRIRLGIVAAIVLAGLLGAAGTISAQDNYEIQVYPSETVEKGHTMVELHSNFTFQGSKEPVDGMLPTNHQLHETIEITHGFTDWFEVGFYIFTAEKSGLGIDWVGDHIRPRVAVPKKWKWPVGVSVSQAIGYQRRHFSADTWTYELRPIVDKQLGRWYFAFNPAFEKSLHGANQNAGFEFSPNFKVSYDMTKKVAAGFEYYGALGPVTGFDAISEQQQQFFPAIDLNLSPKWEVNFGVGVGVTRSTDHLIAKMILGYRFNF